MFKKYRDCVNNFCVNKNNKTPITSFDKVTANKYFAVSLKLIKYSFLFLGPFFRNRVLFVRWISIWWTCKTNETIDRVRGIIHSNRRLTIKEVAEDSRRQEIWIYGCDVEKHQLSQRNSVKSPRSKIRDRWYQTNIKSC